MFEGVHEMSTLIHVIFHKGCQLEFDNVCPSKTRAEFDPISILIQISLPGEVDETADYLCYINSAWKEYEFC